MPTREDLYAALDRYCEALLARDHTRLEWAGDALVTENNVALEPGDGLWGTITGLGPYDLRFADVRTSQVALFTTVTETRDTSGACIRIGLRGDAIDRRRHDLAAYAVHAPPHRGLRLDLVSVVAIDGGWRLTRLAAFDGL